MRSSCSGSNSVPEFSLIVRRKFWSRVVIDSSGCWLWHGYKDQGGYGLFYSGRMYRAHRVAYSLSHGPLTPGLVIMHLCDTVGCVRPGHLREGTHQENVLDCWRKGRNRQVPTGDDHHLRIRPELAPRGERNGNAKLTDAQVRAIKRRLRNGENHLALADELGLKRGMLWAIKTERIWRHIPWDE